MELTRDELTAEDATVPLRWARGLRLGSAYPDDCFDHLPIAESHDRIGDIGLLSPDGVGRALRHESERLNRSRLTTPIALNASARIDPRRSLFISPRGRRGRRHVAAASAPDRLGAEARRPGDGSSRRAVDRSRRRADATTRRYRRRNPHSAHVPRGTTCASVIRPALADQAPFCDRQHVADLDR